MSIGRWVGGGGLIGAVCGALVGVFVVKEPRRLLRLAGRSLVPSWGS